MTTFRCITHWRDNEGNHFNRHHEREAATKLEAIELELEHSEARAKDGMREDGWSFTISVRP